MKLYYIALTDVTINEFCVKLTLSQGSLGEVLAGLRAHELGRAESVCLSTADREASAALLAPNTLVVKVDGDVRELRLSGDDKEAVEGLMLDFLMHRAFPEQHLDLTLAEADSGKHCDVVVRVAPRTDTARLIESVKTREDFIRFTEELAADYQAIPDSWDNPDLSSYLSAIAAWARDCDRYCENTDEAPPRYVNWGYMATLLYTGKIYK